MNHTDEKTSPKLASIAARVLRDPYSAPMEDIRRLAASCLTQAADKPRVEPETETEPDPQAPPP